VRIDVDRHDVVYPLTEQLGDSTVPAAGVQHRLVPSKCEAELVDAADAVAKLAGRRLGA
jgi:hypothetical protein